MKTTLATQPAAGVECECCRLRAAVVELAPSAALPDDIAMIGGGEPYLVCISCVQPEMRSQAAPLPAAADWVALALAEPVSAGAPS